MIVTKNLSKSYKGVQAVDKVSLRVEKGEIYGFLGLNGAGKTTMIRMLLGMIRPSSGQCSINNQPISAGAYHIWNDVGYMVESPHAYPELTVRENLEVVAHLRNVLDLTSVDAIMERLRLNQYKDRKAKHLSLGNTQRLGIAKALLHKPSVLLLDEPTNGLDPAGIVEIRSLLQELAAKENVTIFISSHLLDEVSKIAAKIGIIHEGRLLQELTKSELEQKRQVRLWIEARNLTKAANVLTEAGYSVCQKGKDRLKTESLKAVKNPDLVAECLVKAGTPPTKLYVEKEDLESYFLRVIGQEGGGES